MTVQSACESLSNLTMEHSQSHQRNNKYHLRIFTSPHDPLPILCPNYEYRTVFCAHHQQGMCSIEPRWGSLFKALPVRCLPSPVSQRQHIASDCTHFCCRGPELIHTCAQPSECMPSFLNRTYQGLQNVTARTRKEALWIAFCCQPA